MTIKQRQHLLAYLGYYIGAIDGDWGAGSRAACTAFQRDRNITADGYGGPETDKQLRYAVANDLFRWEPVEDEVVVSKNETTTGTFWDHIRYWKREEFRCRCGEYHAPYCNGFPVEPDQTLVELVDDLRHSFGRPGHPSSGIRCEQHNADQPNSAPNSKHKYGKALDFFIEGVSGSALLARAQADPRTNYAYIIDGQYVHVDVA